MELSPLNVDSKTKQKKNKQKQKQKQNKTNKKKKKLYVRIFDYETNLMVASETCSKERKKCALHFYTK